MWKTLLINIIVRAGSDFIIKLLRTGADVLESRKDNDFADAGSVKSILSGVKVNGKNS